MKFNEFKIVEAPDLMTQYNQGGKKALPAIKDLQTKLQAAGFDPNGIDGKYGPGTFKAVQAYQKANGLQADGQAGDATLAKINTASTAKPTATSTATPTAKPTATPTATPVKDKTAPPPKVSTEGVSETPAETKSKRVLKHKVAFTNWNSYVVNAPFHVSPNYNSPVYCF